MKKIVLALILICLGYTATAQNIASSEAFLIDNIKKVTVDDEVIEQSFEKGDYDCTYIISINNTSDDDAYAYEFNAADLNEYKVGFDTKKNEIFVNLETKGGKDLIREIENDQVEGYTDEITFHAADLEHARSLTENLKMLVKACSDLQEDIVSVIGENPGMGDVLDYLTANIRDVTVNGVSFGQKFSFNPDHTPLMQLEVTDQAEAELIRYEFNASDINPSSIQFDTKKEFVLVSGETKDKADLIKLYENDAVDGFENSFTIYAPNIEEARKLVEVFKFYANEAARLQPKELNLLENAKTLSAINAFISAHIQEVTVDDETFKQTYDFQPDEPALASLKIENVADAEVTEYNFNLADLNKSEIDFQTKGNEIIIELPAEHKYIRVIENGELQNYGDEIELRARSIEEARLISSGFKKAAEFGASELDKAFIKGNPTPSQQETIKFLGNTIQEVATGDDIYRQKFEVDEENNCIVLLEITDVSKAEIIVYKFNLIDINPMKVEFETSGDEVQVNLTTMGGNDLIEVIENGETDDFEDAISLRAGSIEQARDIETALKHLIDLCKGN